VQLQSFANVICNDFTVADHAVLASLLYPDVNIALINRTCDEWHSLTGMKCCTDSDDWFGKH